MKTSLVVLDGRLIGAESTGDSTYWTNLVRNLRADHSLDYLVISNKSKPQNVTGIGHLRWLHLPSSSSRLWSLMRFPLEARRQGASLVHTQYSVSPLLRGRSVSTVHDVSFLVEPLWFTPKDVTLLSAGVRAAARYCRRIITVSKTSKRDIEALVPGAKDKIDVVYNAPSPDVICDLEAKIVEEELAGLGVRKPYLLTAGTGWQRKNLGLAVEAFCTSNLCGPFQLVVAGKPGTPLPVSDNVLETGYVTERQLAALYRGATLYLAPSLYEGFGITIVEAMATGCPVVCSSGGAQPEVAGDAAIVVDSFEPQVWRQVMEDVVRNGSMLEDLRLRGRRRAADFCWAESAQQTASIYLGVIESLPAA